MSNESKELAAKAKSFDSKKAVDLLLDNALYILMIVAVIYIQVFKNSNFLRPSSLINILSQTAAYLPLALGIAGCIVLTGTDLSAGRCVGLTACISASLLQAVTTSNKMWPEIGTLPIPVVILIAMGIGAAVGVFNGFFVAKFKLHPFIVTLGTQLILYSCLLLYVKMGNNGGMAEYVRYPKTCVISRVPDEMSLEQAALIEPYGCSKHAVDRANISNEDVVVISGAGTLGLGMITYARMKNPKLLIVLDMQQNRLDKAKEFGADLVFNPGECDVDKEIKALTDGYGCDIYIEATGNPASVIQGLTIIRKLGTFVEFSVFGKETTADWSIIGDRKELNILGSHLSPYAYPFVIENMLKGNLKTDGVVSHIFKIEEWEKAFDYATGKYGDFKVAFQFD